MSDDRRSEPDARILRQMVRELSEDPLPELPWEKMEASLFASLEAGPVQSGHTPRESADAEPTDERPSIVPELGRERPSAIPAALADRESLVAPEPAAVRSAPRSSVGRWARGVAIVAALAAGVGGLYFVSATDPRAPTVAIAEPIDASQVPNAPGMPAGVLDARSLKVGDVVEAALGPLAFGASEATPRAEEDKLAWTLSAGSRAVVREPASAAVHVVELESGSVHVEATGPKRFVVRAGQTEVASAVRGAIFTVTRSSRGLVVHVESGSVLVGDRGVAGEGGKSGEGRLLDGPVRASVSLDGARDVELIPDRVAAMMQPPAHKTEAPEVVSSPDSPSPVAEPPQGPRPGEPAPASQPPRVGAPAIEPSAAPAPAAAAPPSEASIRASVQRCFGDVQAKKAPNEGVSVSVSSTLRVVVRADGSVQGVTFNPPLGPDLQSCAVFLFRENLGPGERTLAIPVAASAGRPSSP